LWRARQHDIGLTSVIHDGSSRHQHSRGLIPRSD
jgi:hypothetical protein